MTLPLSQNYLCPSEIMIWLVNGCGTLMNCSFHEVCPGSPAHNISLKNESYFLTSSRLKI